MKSKIIYAIERDDAEFVKVFAAGVAASYSLSKSAQGVFRVVLDLYQDGPENKGNADFVKLSPSGEGLDIGMARRTFQRGLKELLEKRFIYPRDPASFWLNPAVFIKGRT